ncbi:MAG: outer membrane beta-barrel protein [Pseudomonadota bacterium]
MSRVIASIILLFIGAHTASAQAFDGPYVGLQFGAADVDTDIGVDGDDSVLGFHAGINLSAGQYVYGGEFDYDQIDLELSGGAGELEQVTRLKARGGVDVGSTFVYGTAGVAYARTSDLGNENGYFYGLGASFDLPAPGSVGVEYLRHEFSDFDGSSVDVDADTLTLRYSYNF